MSSTPAAQDNATTNAAPMLGADDISIDIRVGRNKHMAFCKADPVAMATYLSEADQEFLDAFLKAAHRYMPTSFPAPTADREGPAA